MQAFNGADGSTFQNDATSDWFHAEDANFHGNKLRQYLLLEAVEMRVHHIDRHLHGVKTKTVRAGRFEHLEMNVRVFVTGEPDKPRLAHLIGVFQRLNGAAFRK